MRKSLARLFFKLLYRPIIRLEALQKALATDERVVLLPHYNSYIDPVLFALFSPGDPFVVIPLTLSHKPWFNWFAPCIRHIVADYEDPFALKKIEELLADEKYVILFAEPEPTTSGILMKLSDMIISVLEKSGALLVPARANGTQFTGFSRMKERFARHLAPRVTLFADSALKLPEGANRHKASLLTESMLMDVIARSLWDRKPLFDTMLEQRKLWGPKHIVAMEPDGTAIDWNGMIARVFILKKVVESLSAFGERLGIMLPNTVMTLASIIGTQVAGREPAMINYSMGPRSLISACETASVGSIVTSRRFVEEGKFASLVESLESAGLKFFYLEDRVAALSATQKLSCLFASRCASPSPEPEQAAEKPAVILFTSGSEGTPKPVILTHLNVQANTAQVRATLDFNRHDVMMALMPMFHSFGLCTGVFMSLSTGMAIAFYPTPLHYKKIPAYSYRVKGTVMLGTNAFLAGYAKSADPFDFFEMRYVVCGGDKLKESTARLWMEKFGIRVLEGYGVTECSPVVGVNRLGRYKFGSIGKSLPLVRPTLKPVEGVNDGGILIVRGPNIMKGYIKADGSILPPPESGYETGDIVSIDEEGFITIQGRAKRFAKIGGEMVSLTQIEGVIQEIWPDDGNAIVSIPDEVRGEIIVLLTEREKPDMQELKNRLQERGLPELALPKKIIKSEIPKIGVGKVDYTAAAAIAQGQNLGAPPQTPLGTQSPDPGL